MHWIDPEGLPETVGTLERFVINDNGDLDGMVLNGSAGDALVHFPPHLGREVLKLFGPGATVHVRGVRPRGAALVAAISLGDGDGKVVTDNGPDAHGEPKSGRRKWGSGEISGTVRFSLFGPKGELRGAMLDDGTVLRIGPKEAKAVDALLRPGAAVRASGESVQTPYGRAYAVTEIADPNARTKKPKPKPRGKPRAKQGKAKKTKKK